MTCEEALKNAAMVYRNSLPDPIRENLDKPRHECEKPEIIDELRRRYFDSYRRLQDDAAILGGFMDICEFAEAHQIALWKKFAEGASASLTGQQDKAMTLIDEAIEIDPLFAPVWNGKGVVLHRQRRYEEAVKAYDAAIYLDRRYALPWYNGALIFETRIYMSQRLRCSKATAWYEQAFEISPDYPFLAAYNTHLQHEWKKVDKARLIREESDNTGSGATHAWTPITMF